jgi:hypothetical protein
MEPEQKEEVKEASLADKLRALLQEFDNAPTVEAIDGMKAKHGDVFLSALNDDEVFLFRSLTRKEHRSLNAQVAEGKLEGSEFEEQVVNTCVLWKSSVESFDKAGTVPSLFEQIMQNSNFLSPQLLSNLVTKL